MAYCDNKCVLYSAKYDKMRQSYNDTIVKANETQKHFCAMFDDGIPQEIWENGGCPYIQQNGIMPE